ncbi:MAG: FHA domain-containing protein [Dehalococcoidia bacterium]
MADVAARFGSLVVADTDGRSREYAIDLASTTIGRAEGSAIVIDDLSISRRHARLTIEDGRLLVEDLGSAAGTFVAGRAIPPHTPSLVEPGDEVRFGEVAGWFIAATDSPSEDRPVDAGDPIAEAPATIRATLQPPLEPIEPGTTPGIATLQVQNRGRIVDQLDIEVRGIPAEWVRVGTPAPVLVPNDQATVSIVIQPPRSSEARAGDYDISVVVTSRETGREVLTAARITLQPFENTQMLLHPMRSSKRFDLIARNLGNAPLTYDIAGRDDEEAFYFNFGEDTVHLEPGEERRIAMSVRSKTARLIGATQTAPIEVRAVPVGGGLVEARALGQLLVRPPTQRFVFPAFLLFMVGVAVLAAEAYILRPVWPFVDDRSVFVLDRFLVWLALGAVGGALLSPIRPLWTPDDDWPRMTFAVFVALLLVLSAASTIDYYFAPGWPFATMDGRSTLHETLLALSWGVGAALVLHFLRLVWWAQGDRTALAAQTFSLFTMVGAIIGGVSYVAIDVWPDDGEPTRAELEAYYAGVHMCDPDGGPADGASDAGGRDSVTDDTNPTESPLFAQNNGLWAKAPYARADDPDTGPGACGESIEQCGCVLTTVATVMAMYELLELPDGTELTPESLNAWFNADATRTASGWVSRGYVFGDVVWTAVNELSGEIARRNPGTKPLRFSRTGTGSNEEILTELRSGRPIVLEIPGHWIVAYKIDGGDILINDPYYRNRTTLADYTDNGVPILSSVLFEHSDDLSAVVITVPRNARVRVTDNEGRVVGTLDLEEDADTAAMNAQEGIGGAQYNTRRAWRDPTCVMSPPPLDAGTNQIILPGTAAQYEIDVRGPEGEEMAVAIHEYDANGVSKLTTQEFSDQSQTGVEYDPAQPNATVTVIPPTTTSTPDPGAGGGGGAEVTPTATPEETATPQDTPTPVPTPTATPPIPPSNVAVACEVEYEDMPKRATVTCKGTVEGNYTQATFRINGVVAAADGLVMDAVFDFNTTLNVQLNACNTTACAASTAAVAVEFPAVSPTPTPTPTATLPGGPTSTPTPPAPAIDVSVVCNAVSDGSQWHVGCAASFNGQWTSILWSAPGATPNSAETTTKNWQFTVPGAGLPVTVAATVCNFDTCTGAPIVIVNPEGP